MPTTIPTVYQFLYQEEGAGESSSFLLGYDTNKYYLHNDFDYTDANLSLKPGVSLSLQSPKVSIAIGNTANDYFKLTNSADTKKTILSANDEAISVYTPIYFSKLVYIGSNNERPDFTGWLTNLTLYANSALVSTNGLVLEGKGTSSGTYHSHAIIKTDKSTSPKMYLGVYANSADELMCKIDSILGTGQYGSKLSLGGQATEINLEVGGNQYFKVGVEENKTGAYIKNKDGGWSGVLSNHKLKKRYLYTGRCSVVFSNSNESHTIYGSCSFILDNILSTTSDNAKKILSSMVAVYIVKGSRIASAAGSWPGWNPAWDTNVSWYDSSGSSSSFSTSTYPLSSISAPNYKIIWTEE